MRDAAIRVARSIAFGLLLATLAGAANADDEKAAASIPFADLGAIRNFRAVSDRELLIEGSGHRWFRATFVGACLGLRSAEQIAFMTEPGGSLDRFSAIYVDGRRCAFRSFEPTEPPVKREQPPKPRQ